MLTSKERAELRSKANTLDTVLMVGKGGVTENVIAQAETLLDARELVKGRVLETALMSAREVSDAICEATGADGIQCVGSKFVIYRFSKKLEAQRQAERAKEKAKAKAAKKVNPVRAGVQARRKKAREEREKRNAYFKEAAIAAAKERKK
ncbi:YhbY family RNA-binding protein [Candidatus Avoscillospira sp. LCP25S3_F1]|uniref:YhbY family RNA-binding protein n=1 Tax=Candidatus Avoscillospira sp. LCP25S3_F1 TaxID=3438825 RepID=UPI003F8F5808